MVCCLDVDSETGDVLTWQNTVHRSSKPEAGWTKHVKHGWESEDIYSEISSEHKWTKNLMITKFPNTISSGKIILPLSFLFLFLPNRSSDTVYGYTFPHWCLWVCVLEVIGVPSMLRLTLKSTALTRVLPTFFLSVKRTPPGGSGRVHSHVEQPELLKM